MERSTFSTMYFIKRSKKLKNGNAPVYLRITINGNRAETGLSVSLDPKLWDSKRNKAKGNSEEASLVNERIRAIDNRVYNLHKQLLDSGDDFDTSTLMGLLKGKNTKMIKLIDYFQKHNEEMESLIGRDFERSTLTKFHTTIKHLRGYLNKEYGSDVMLIQKVDVEFMRGFERHLKIHHGCVHNSAMKHMKNLKKVINMAVDRDVLKSDPVKAYKMKTEEVIREALTEYELELIKNQKFESESLERVRDMFLVQCYTGLSFSDLSKLKETHILKDISGQSIIKMKRKKTGNEFSVPVFLIVQEIFDKYKHHPVSSLKGTILPCISNQKTNEYLKVIADLCGIKKKLVSHLGRHTFATTVALSNGVPMETLSYALGHRKIASTKIYGKIQTEKMVDDFRRAMNQ